MSFFEDMEKSLLEAIEIEKGNMPLKKRNNMPAPTFYVPNDDDKLIDELINIRKSKNISQSELAEQIGVKQQSISRIEQKKVHPTFKMFYSMVDALGYELQIVKK